jgi:hypothetical protein
LLPAVGVASTTPLATVTVFVKTQPKGVFVTVTVYVPAGNPDAVFAPATPEVVDTIVPAAFVQT